jgi:predicted acylesterase/phospholipase RssA
VLPVKAMVIGTDVVRLTDGGISDSLPVDFLRSPLMGATHIIASDCRASAPAPPSGSDWLVYIRPALDGIRSLHGPRDALMKAVCRGEAAVTPEVVEQIQSWMHVPVAS